MIDITRLFNTALNIAIEEAIAPLSARIRELEEEVTMLRNTPPAVTPTLTPTLETKEGEMPITWESIKGAIEDIVAAEISHHLGEYDHAEFLRVCNELDEYCLGDFMTSDDVEEKIRDTLRDATVTLDI